MYDASDGYIEMMQKRLSKIGVTKEMADLDNIAGATPEEILHEVQGIERYVAAHGLPKMKKEEKA